MKRVFIALKVEAGETLIRIISLLKSGLASGNIRWTATDNIHITLVFIGDTEDRMIAAINSMLKDKCEGSGTFELILRGSGVFKSLSDPRIIWTGIDPSEKLMQLNSIIVNGLRETGTKIEERPFNPHLTLGRIKHLNDNTILKPLLDRFQNTVIQKVPVNEVILYESILKPEGPFYKTINKFNL